MKNGGFCRFGGSAGWPKDSAELFRPILTEASAEISVSVVHYSHLSQIKVHYLLFSLLKSSVPFSLGTDGPNSASITPWGFSIDLSMYFELKKPYVEKPFL